MAIEFDGSTDYYYYNGAIRVAEPFTYACWFYLTSAAANSGLVGQGNTSWQHFAEMFGTTGQKVAVRVGDTGGNQTVSTTTTYSLDTWNHACARIVAHNNRYVYLNGGGEGRGTSVVSPTPAKTVIGAIYNGGTITWHATGYIALAAIWHVDLTTTEIAKLAAGISPLAVRPYNLSMYCPMIVPQNPLVDYRGPSLGEFGTPVAAPHPPVQTFPAPPISIDVGTPYVPPVGGGAAAYQRRVIVIG